MFKSTICMRTNPYNQQSGSWLIKQVNFGPDLLRLDRRASLTCVEIETAGRNRF
jgi:hypothetical protein